MGSVKYTVEYQWDLILQPEAALYDLGQCFLHNKYGYRGCIVGWDDECRQPDEWCQAAGVDDLPLGRAQPFYKVLVDGETVSNGTPGTPSEIASGTLDFDTEGELTTHTPAATRSTPSTHARASRA